MTATLRLMLADDHQLVRAALRALLGTLTYVELVAEACDGEMAIALITRLKPDVALLDIAMPRLTGLGVLGRMRSMGSPTLPIIVSMYDRAEHVAEALRLGARGYIIKNSAVEELDLALHIITRGEVYVSPALARCPAHDAAVRPAESAALTPRQVEVLRLIALGRSSKAIAAQLQLSAKTVETHRAQLMERLGVHDLTSVVRYAVRTGVISPDEA